MKEQKANQTITISLTDERPASIKPKYWPSVASAAQDRDHNNQELFRRYYLRVRQHDTGAATIGDETHLTPHADGKCIVYGRYETSYQGEAGCHAGYRCHIDDVVATIRKVAERIECPQNVTDECIADLPAAPDEDQEQGLPCDVTITITVQDMDQARGMARAMIDWERSARAEAECVTADEIARVRRNLQERAGLVAPNQS